MVAAESHSLSLSASFFSFQAEPGRALFQEGSVLIGDHMLGALLREEGFQIISGSSSYSQNPFASLIFHPCPTSPADHGSIMTPAPYHDDQDLTLGAPPPLCSDQTFTPEMFRTWSDISLSSHNSMWQVLFPPFYQSGGYVWRKLTDLVICISGNSDRFYFLGLQNHCHLQPLK